MVSGTEVLGLAASLTTAALWGLGAVVARLGMLRAKPTLLNLVSVLVALPVLLGIAAFTGQPLFGTPLTIDLLLVLFGVALCSQVFGSLLNYDSIRFIGASRNTTISGTRILFSAALGVALLAEGITLSAAAGSGLVIAGVLALTVRRGGEGPTGFRMGRGVAEALAGTFVFSVGNVLVRVASEGAPPVEANLVADLIALPMMLALVAADRGGAKVQELDGKTWQYLVVAGLVTALASYSFFVALSVAPVVYVIPLSSSTPLFAMLFSLVTIRRLEHLNRRLLLGALLTVAGSVLVALQF